MSQSEAADDRLGAVCGWGLAAVLALAPLIAWLAPLGFAPLVALLGLAALPALRVSEEDRPATLAIIIGVLWACGSMVWSPYRPKDLEGATALKLALQAPLYWSALCAARRASPRARFWALRLYAWGLAALGVLLLAEAMTGAGIYRALRVLTHDPIRPDLAVKNVAQTTFVLALLWPTAAVAGARTGAGRWLAAPMLAGVVAGGHALGADAPLIAAALSTLVTAAVFWRPRAAPAILGVLAGLMFLIAPYVVMLARVSGLYARLEAAVPLSWSERMGYWRHAADWISDHPLRGWGLDASRMFAPGIRLHPHDAPLQIWLELGVIGAVAAAVLWVVIFMRLRRSRPDAALAAAAGSAVAYLVFNAVSFGVWQEWWLALGALAACAGTAVARQPAAAPSPARAPVAMRSSTMAPISD